MGSKDTQNAMILKALKEGREIVQVVPPGSPNPNNAIDALHEFNCMRLASRIHDIHEMIGDTKDVDGKWRKVEAIPHSANGKRWVSYKWRGQLSF